MSVLNIHYQDMREEVLEQAQKLILETFENNKEERIIANKIRQEFDKTHGKLPISEALFFTLPTTKVTLKAQSCLCETSFDCGG